MNNLVRQVRDFFVSLKVTVALLGFGMVLIFAATLAQVDLGVWGVQKEFFHAFIAIWHVGPLFVPLPGGYLVGGLLLINLISAHLYRFKFTWRKSGIFLTHIGLILLLVGELLSGLWQEEFQMSFSEGQTKNYAQSPRHTELALIDTTDPKFDDVVAIPEKLLQRNEPLQYAKLPFLVVPKIFYPNGALAWRSSMPNASPSPATAGRGTEIVAVEQSLTYKENERNVPVAFVELVASDKSLGTWLVSPQVPFNQSFEYAGHRWRIELRFKRNYEPFSVSLLKVTNDFYPGTDTPKNFSSRVRLNTPGGGGDREVLIYMNNPLRYSGLTFYQHQMDIANRSSVLQVVRNPSWLMPYISCALITLGLVIQFGIHLVGFATRRVASKRTA